MPASIPSHETRSRGDRRIAYVGGRRIPGRSESDDLLVDFEDCRSRYGCSRWQRNLQEVQFFTYLFGLVPDYGFTSFKFSEQRWIGYDRHFSFRPSDLKTSKDDEDKAAGKPGGAGSQKTASATGGLPGKAPDLFPDKKNIELIRLFLQFLEKEDLPGVC